MRFSRHFLSSSLSSQYSNLHHPIFSSHLSIAATSRRNSDEKWKWKRSAYFPPHFFFLTAPASTSLSRQSSCPVLCKYSRISRTRLASRSSLLRSSSSSHSSHFFSSLNGCDRSTFSKSPVHSQPISSVLPEPSSWPWVFAHGYCNQ